MSHKYMVRPATGEVFAYEIDGSQDSFIPQDLRPMSGQEIQRHLNPEPSYWTDGISLALSYGGMPGWRIASSAEVEALRPALLLREATEKAAELRQAADYAIAPLQDAVDLDESTEAEAAALKEWKRYRLALGRLPAQPGYPELIDWPTPPA
ncbi:hypothetical protein Q5O_09840 [Pseudomonas putida JB]|uniref:tail fiber assembly protein n=1 Tax=Pseudomonas putida TaxID=303 RepID=UPI0008780D9A|nr:tail fiber assembly protein [Pseudomonas putida]AOX08678.1 hypothetical protein Q5O_09840 [Pseudomonas putida JB]